MGTAVGGRSLRPGHGCHSPVCSQAGRGWELWQGWHQQGQGSRCPHPLSAGGGIVYPRDRPSLHLGRCLGREGKAELVSSCVAASEQQEPLGVVIVCPMCRPEPELWQLLCTFLHVASVFLQEFNKLPELIVFVNAFQL